jgi:hypothetical protein
VDDAWPYILLGLLGAYHGINPAMGWLFAVALGMQERSRRAVLRSLLPIAIGHELSIVLVAVLVLGLGLVADTHHLHLAAGLSLIAFGIFRFVRPHAHFRSGAKLQVNRRELGWWSFLMSTAHGAGLMVAPVLIGVGAAGTAEASSTDHELAHVEAAMLSPAAGGLALLLHVASMMLVMAIVAVVVYEKLGVAILRQAWLNTEWLWAGAFVMAGVVTLFT